MDGSRWWHVSFTNIGWFDFLQSIVVLAGCVLVAPFVFGCWLGIKAWEGVTGIFR